MFSSASYMHRIINRVIDFTAISLLSNLVCQDYVICSEWKSKTNHVFKIGKGFIVWRAWMLFDNFSLFLFADGARGKRSAKLLALLPTALDVWKQRKQEKTNVLQWKTAQLNLDYFRHQPSSMALYSRTEHTQGVI